MNEKLISNWNEVVQENDVVYHLGDFTMSRYSDPQEVFFRLNGRKHLIAGNHDYAKTLNLPWVSIHDFLLLTVDERIAMLSHYPMESWPRSHYGSFHFHGHTHGKLPRRNLNRVDVGVDCWNYFPITFQTACESLNALPNETPISVLF